MKSNRRSCVNRAAKLLTASAIALGTCGPVLAQSSDDSDARNIKGLQEVLVGLQGLIGNVGALAAETPKTPGFYDKDASGKVISVSSVAGNSPNNIRLGVPSVSAETNPVIANLPQAPAIQAKVDARSTDKNVSIADAAPKQPPMIAAKPAEPVAAVASASQGAPAPVVATVAPKPVPLVVVVAAPKWAFKPNATMEETLASWANASGWKAPQWKASLPATAYRIKEGDPVSGSFFDALQAMAAAVPQVDINVSPESHELIVTDAKVKKVAQLP